MRTLLAFLIALSASCTTTSSAHADRLALQVGEGWTLRAHAKAYGAPDSSGPTTGRFLSLDPVQGSLSDPLSTQGFIYGRANPARFTDPDGRQDALSAVLGMQRLQLCPTGREATCPRARAHENFILGATSGSAMSGACLLAPAACGVALGAGLLTSGAPTVAIAEDVGSTASRCFSDDVLLLSDAELEQCQLFAGGVIAGGPEFLLGAGFAAHSAGRFALSKFAAAGARAEMEQAAMAVAVVRWTVAREAAVSAGVPAELAPFMGKARALGSSSLDARGLRPSRVEASAAERTVIDETTANEYRVVDASDSEIYARAEVSWDGVLELNFQTKYKTPQGSEVRGTLRGADEFDRAFAHFDGQFDRIRATWDVGPNSDNFNAFVKTGDPFQTWTGQQAKRHGFTEVESVNRTWLTDDGLGGGDLESVDVVFRRPR